MHPASEQNNLDGLLAASLLLSEKPRHGVSSKNPALHLGINEANSTAAIGLRAGLALEAVRSRYTGKERDSESGLDNFGARYMGSSMGRFMSPDWAAKAEPVAQVSILREVFAEVRVQSWEVSFSYDGALPDQGNKARL
jgi:RHS repeat-associated protein